MSVEVFFMAGTLCAVSKVRALTCCPGFNQKYIRPLTHGTLSVIWPVVTHLHQNLILHRIPLCVIYASQSIQTLHYKYYRPLADEEVSVVLS